ncbi:MAG: AMP-binding protein [Vicinamibacterales bacterium]
MTDQAATAPPVGGQLLIPGGVLERFDAIAAQHATKPALADSGGEWTYATVHAMHRQIAAATAARAGRQEVVAVLLGHEKRFPAALLGVFAAGCICLPLDPEHPAARNRRIATHAGVTLVITAGDWVATSAQLFPQAKVLDLDELVTSGEPPGDRRPQDTDGAYIIYTSGSTGTPKGVYWEHRSIDVDAAQNIRRMQIGAGDRVAMFYSPTVAAGMRTCLTTLLSGASGHVVPISAGAAAMARQIQAHRLTVLRSSPALFRHLVDALAPGERLPSVRLVLLGGDRVTWQDFDVFKRGCRADAAFGVHLGATECSVHTEWIVDEGLRRPGARLPVGWPLAERPIRLLDPEGAPVTDGDMGECVVASRFIARAYWNDPDRTAQAFGADPADAEVRTYRTGDLAIRRADGMLEYVGRNDEQIKIAGRRVEPGEIEAALRSCDGIRDGALVARRADDGSVQAIVAYVEREPAAKNLLSRHVKAMVRTRVPQHMVPTQVVFVDRLPRLPTLKIDRMALQESDRRDMASPRAASTDVVVRCVCEVIETTLGIEGVTIEDSLASVGGDSLHVVEVANKLERRLGIRLPLDELEAAQSVGDLAAHLSEMLRARGPRGPAVAAERTRARRDEVVRVQVARGREHVSWRAACEALLAAPPATLRPHAAVPDRGDLRHWLVTIDTMLQTGAIEPAREEVTELVRRHPHVKVAQTWQRILALLPPDDEANTFADDPDRDVQIRVRDGSDTLLVLFAGHALGFGVASPLLQRWLNRVPATIVYLRDRRRRHYLRGIPAFGDERRATISALAYIGTRIGATRVLCWGHSAGAAGAIQYGLELGSEAVVSVAGPINFSHDFNVYLRWAWLASRLRRVAAGAMVDLRAAMLRAGRVPRTLLVYGDDYWDDRIQAEYLRGVPGVTHVPIANCDNHHVIRELLRRGWYEPVMTWLMTGGESPLPAIIPDSAGALNASGNEPLPILSI